MARPKITRRIAGIPTVSGFNPYGSSITGKKLEPVFLLYEEYEALRLCDYEKYNQEAASALMRISRPTLTRIYISAREKIALAMVEGRKIIIEGGKVVLDSEWFHCNACGCYFEKQEEENAGCCTLCGSQDISAYNPDEEKSDNTELTEQSVCTRDRGEGGGNRRRKRSSGR